MGTKTKIRWKCFWRNGDRSNVKGFAKFKEATEFSRNLIREFPNIEQVHIWTHEDEPVAIFNSVPADKFTKPYCLEKLC